MTNNLVWPLLALVLAVLAAAFPLSRGDQPPPLRGLRAGSLVASLVVVVFTASTLMWPATFSGQGAWIALALALGSLFGVISNGVDNGKRGFAIGLAVLGASILHFLPAAARDAASLAYISGTFIGSFATGTVEAVSSGSLCSFAALGIVSVDFLARAGTTQTDAAPPGTILGLAFLVAVLISGLLSRAGRFASAGMGLVVLALIGFLACWRYFSSAELATLWVGGIAVGLAISALLAGEEQPEAFRFVLATIIWLAAATVAFGVGLGYGMAVALFAGISTLAILGSTRGLMSLTVAAVILVYRLFREMYPDEARAPDIGQHYTMIGLAAGALVPLLPLEWIRQRHLSGVRSTIATLLWLVILIGMPVASAVLLGSKGAIGMIVGFGFAAFIEGMRGGVSLAPTAMATGLAAFVATSFGWLGDWSDLERAVKIRAVVYIALITLILAAALTGLSRSKADEK